MSKKELTKTKNGKLVYKENTEIKTESGTKYVVDANGSWRRQTGESK